MPRSPELDHIFQVVTDNRRKTHLQTRVMKRNFSVFACNCWGGYLYQDLGLRYLTPFVSLYLHPPCYLGFMENFNEAIRAPLEFIDKSKYNGELNFPIGLILDKYEIHFMHYASRTEALEKWNRRRERVAASMTDCYFMLMTLGTYRVPDWRRFARLPFPNKVLFTDESLGEGSKAVIVPPQNAEPEFDDGPALYKRCHRYFDLPAWLNNGGSLC